MSLVTSPAKSASTTSWLVLALCVFVALAVAVMTGVTQSFDVAFLRVLRDEAVPSTIRGPAWVSAAMAGVTILGSTGFLGLVVCIASGVLLFRGQRITAIVVPLSALSGGMVSELLKWLFDRARPDVVPHLQSVVSASFPSGHAMQSAIVYLTLGALLMHTTPRRQTKIAGMAAAILLILPIGVSRVFLGVHYPTDVLGGWLLGACWASLTMLMIRRTG
jgi:undecaprenyl-diphosphatase